MSISTVPYGVARRTTLGKDDWARAALEVIAANGVDAVTVEGVARGLGVTKGSFYWHFPDRSALVAAALDLWEEQGTRQVIDRLRQERDPELRLRLLFEVTFGDQVEGPVDVALLARAGERLVGPVVRRVTTARIAFIEELYRDFGLAPAQAAQQARLTYCAYVGHMQVRRSLPDDLVLARPSRSYRRRLLAALTPLERRAPEEPSR